MNLNKIYEIYNLFKNDNFAFVYRGIFSNNILNLTTDLIQNNEELKSTGVQNKLSYLTIESFQNVIRYSDTKQSYNRCNDLFIFRKVKDNFFITTANLINKNKTEKIESYLDKLNTLNDRELRELYLEILTNQKFTEKGGAGLGFIEMIRKSKNRLNYRFVPFNTNFNYFFFQIQVNQNRKTASYRIPISQSVEINQITRQIKALMIQKANFTSATVHPTIKIVKHNIATTDLPVQKKIFSIMVELLQDLSTYTELLEQKREAVFILGMENHKFYFLVGSIISSKILNQKLRLIDKYITKSKEEILDYYYSNLLNDEFSTNDLRTLKILTLGSNYQYQAEQLDDKLNFFVQKIEIDV